MREIMDLKQYVFKSIFIYTDLKTKKARGRGHGLRLPRVRQSVVSGHLFEGHIFSSLGAARRLGRRLRRFRLRQRLGQFPMLR